MSLDTTPLANAVQRLREGLGRHRTELRDEQLRDGLIQRFEFTYELSHKTICSNARLLRKRSRACRSPS